MLGKHPRLITNEDIPGFSFQEKRKKKKNHCDFFMKPAILRARTSAGRCKRRWCMPAFKTVKEMSAPCRQKLFLPITAFTRGRGGASKTNSAPAPLSLLIKCQLSGWDHLFRKWQAFGGFIHAFGSRFRSFIGSAFSAGLHVFDLVLCNMIGYNNSSYGYATKNSKK